ncbi:MAG TPA: hypothetical protein VGK21_01590 [Candidatus Angelobacter sp.]
MSIALLLTCTALAQKQHRPASADDLALIQRASESEIAELESPRAFRYQETLDWNWGSETRSVIETAGGRADRIVSFNGEPLSPEQQAKQEHRLNKLLSDHDALKNELKDQQSETQRRVRMVKAFPKAFIFGFAGSEKSLLRFDFRPDPEFSPKDRETQMYRGMEGSVWIEPVQERIVRIEGLLVKDVSFGWGIVGHLYKGGIYGIAQTQLSPGKWRITKLDVDLKGKMFLFNSFRFQRKETDSRFHPVSSHMTLSEAIQELLDTPEQEQSGKHPPLPKQNPRNQRHPAPHEADQDLSQRH